jgi:hypothetical protein
VNENRLEGTGKGEAFLLYWGAEGGGVVVDKIDCDVASSRLRSLPDCFNNNAVSGPSGKNII